MSPRTASAQTGNTQPELTPASEWPLLSATWSDIDELAIPTYLDDGPSLVDKTYRTLETKLDEAYPGLEYQLMRWAPTGWERWQWEARKSAAVWRLARAHGWLPDLRRAFEVERPEVLGQPWSEVTDEQLYDVMERRAATVDAVRAAFEARCAPSVVVRVGSTSWVGGLSPRGHLVGFLVRD